MNPEPLLVILNEGTRGHMGQSRGIRDCIARAVPIRSIELEVPRLRGFERFKYIKYQARKLPRAAKKFLKKWLISAGGKHLIEQVSSARCENQPVLFLSAGSSAAPYCLALARFFDGKSCVVMTPSVLGIKPFDMAIVPEHDSSRGDNVLVTLGAPNAIDRNTLTEQSEQLLNDYPASRRKAWGILIGGDD